MEDCFYKLFYVDNPNPKSIFEVWVYSDVDRETETVTGYEVRQFSLSEQKIELTRKDVVETMKEHPELKLW